MYQLADGHEFILKVNNVIDSLTKEQVKNIMERLMYFEWITDLKGKTRFPAGMKPKSARYTHRNYQMIWQQSDKNNSWMN